ncbi:MAG: MmcQ/YjbR family DNA-binding protein [Methanobacteriaceae archaeon]
MPRKEFLSSKYKMDSDKLLNFGFVKKNNQYSYSTNLMGEEFKLIVKISNEEIKTEVLDNHTSEEYMLFNVGSVKGDYILKVKEEYEIILKNIIENCFIKETFQSLQAKEIVKYIKEKYNNEPEFLWKKTPNNAIFREKESYKWYSALLIIEKRKLGIDSDCEVEIINLKNEPKVIESLIDNKEYFPGYHMNKNHWFTILLNESLPSEEIFKWIDLSYDMVKKLNFK